MRLVKKILSLLVFVVAIGCTLFTVIVSVFTYGLYKKIDQKIKAPSPTSKPTPKEDLTAIDDPIEVDLTDFAPFYFWELLDDGSFGLSRFEQNGDIENFELIRKGSKEYPSVALSPDKKKLIITKGNSGFDIFDSGSKQVRNVVIDGSDISHGLVAGSWSPKGDYVYVYNSSDVEANTNFWAVNVTTLAKRKIVNGYRAQVIGWTDDHELGFIDDYELGYMGNPWEDNEKVLIKAMDVRNGSVRDIGQCDDLWVIMCRDATRWIAKDHKMLYSNSNVSELYIYDFKNQSGLKLFDVQSDNEFASTNIRGLAPDNSYLLLNLWTRYANEKAGFYEYNLGWRGWRQIAKQDFQVVLWSHDRPGAVLLKDSSNNKYYHHELESFDVNPVTISDEIAEFIK